MAKPAVILVGVDKDGVGKTTVSRTLLDIQWQSYKKTGKRYHSGARHPERDFKATRSK